MYELHYKRYGKWRMMEGYNTLASAREAARGLARSTGKEVRIERAEDDKFWYVRPPARKTAKKKAAKKKSCGSRWMR